MSVLDQIDEIAKGQKEKQEKLNLKIHRNYERVKKLREFAENTPEYLRELDREFEEETSLNANEILMLFVVVGLQSLRQHFLTRFTERVDDQTGAKRTPGHGEEHSDRHQRYYNPTLQEIIENPVPFDANVGANGALSGGGKMGHRVTALGHDPLLGLVIGTANIATSTLTNSRFESFHIRTRNKRDAFTQRALTSLVLQKTAEKLFYNGIEGKKIVGYSFIKELVHLNSDIDTKNSLPLPVISAIDSEWAAELAEYGFDFSNTLTVAKQVMYARMINSFAAMYHYSFYDGSIPIDLYKVKTKKIICYSNVIASSANGLEVYFSGDKDLLDIGGIANTIFEVVTGVKFKKKVKREFIFGTYDRALAAL